MINSINPFHPPGCDPAYSEISLCTRLFKPVRGPVSRSEINIGYYLTPLRYKSDVTRWRPIFNHALGSFRDTILPNDSVRRDLRSLRRQYAKKPYVGVHIRHGDRYPINQKWRGDYVPISEYLAAVDKVWNTLLTSNPPEVRESWPTVYLASDSYAAFEDYRALSSEQDSIWSLYGETNHRLRYMASPHGYVQRVFSGKKTRIEERIRWTQGMLLEFAMISGMWLENGERGPSGVVCTST